MGDAGPRERWLRVVRDDEVVAPAPAAYAPPEPAAPPPPPEAALPPPPPAPPPRPSQTQRQHQPPHRDQGPRPYQPSPEPAPSRTAVRDPVREGDRGRGAGLARRVLVLLGIVGTGTAGALAADLLMGPADGRPALHLLVVLALPFWDALPARWGPRLLVLAVVLVAVASVWVALAGLRPEQWWRAEVSFGLACAAVGLVQVAVSGRGRAGRTVDR